MKIDLAAKQDHNQFSLLHQLIFHWRDVGDEEGNEDSSNNEVGDETDGEEDGDEEE